MTAIEQLKAAVGEPCWSTEELQRDFDVVGFSHGFVVVVRKRDGVRGSLDFNHSPRVYFNFEEG